MARAVRAWDCPESLNPQIPARRASGGGTATYNQYNSDGNPTLQTSDAWSQPSYSASNTVSGSLSVSGTRTSTYSGTQSTAGFSSTTDYAQYSQGQSAGGGGSIAADGQPAQGGGAGPSAAAADAVFGGTALEEPGLGSRAWNTACTFTRAYGLGLAQGAANIGCTITQAAIGVPNTVPRVWNATAGNWLPKCRLIRNPDWAKGLVRGAAEPDWGHDVSIGAAKVALTAFVAAGSIALSELAAAPPEAPQLRGADAGVGTLPGETSGSDVATTVLEDGSVETTAAQPLAPVEVPPPCFPPGTLVLMAGGDTKKIEEIRTGDMVLAVDPASEIAPEPHRVAETCKNWTDCLIHIEFDSDGDKETNGQIVATRQHLFWTQNREWQRADEIGVGDILQDREGRGISVIGVREENVTSDTHNLLVEDVHTYFVVINGVPILAHNGVTLPGDPVPIGTPVNRWWGNLSPADGQSWATGDIAAQSRNSLGIGSWNSGEYLSQGTLIDNTGVYSQAANPAGVFAGGDTEIIIPNAATQVQLNSVTIGRGLPPC